MVPGLRVPQGAQLFFRMTKSMLYAPAQLAVEPAGVVRAPSSTLFWSASPKLAARAGWSPTPSARENGAAPVSGSLSRRPRCAGIHYI